MSTHIILYNSLNDTVDNCCFAEEGKRDLVDVSALNKLVSQEAQLKFQASKLNSELHSASIAF